jgi:hypothetical protein
MDLPMAQKPRKRFDKLSYGVLALYVAVMLVLGLAVYGINLSTVIMDRNRSDRARAQMQSGRMVIVTEDRTQCRTLRFNNETAELSRETLVDCDPKLGVDSDGSFGVIRDGFMKR